MDNFYEKYSLPTIEAEGITEIELNHREKYLRIYIGIIERCKSMNEEDFSGYCEVHHILPRCMNGTDIKENLVKMPVRYHIIAHMVIVEAYPEIAGLRRALVLITGKNKKKAGREEGLTRISSRLVAKMREEAWRKLKEIGKSPEHRRKISETLKGRKIPRDIVEKVASKLRGRKMSEEQKKKMSELLRGKKRSPETLKRMSAAMLGKKMSAETRHKMSVSTSGEKNPIWGTHRSEETKKKISEKNFGGKNGMARKVKGPDGVIYGSIRDASRENKQGLNYDQICLRVRGINKDSEGWSYLDDENKN
jgi:hypothetical protein